MMWDRRNRKLRAQVPCWKSTFNIYCLEWPNSSTGELSFKAGTHPKNWLLEQFFGLVHYKLMNCVTSIPMGKEQSSKFAKEKEPLFSSSVRCLTLNISHILFYSNSYTGSCQGFPANTFSSYLPETVPWTFIHSYYADHAMFHFIPAKLVVRAALSH